MRVTHEVHGNEADADVRPPAMGVSVGLLRQLPVFEAVLPATAVFLMAHQALRITANALHTTEAITQAQQHEPLVLNGPVC